MEIWKHTDAAVLNTLSQTKEWFTINTFLNIPTLKQFNINMWRNYNRFWPFFFSHRYTLPLWLLAGPFISQLIDTLFLNSKRKEVNEDSCVLLQWCLDSAFRFLVQGSSGHILLLTCWIFHSSWILSEKDNQVTRIYAYHGCFFWSYNKSRGQLKLNYLVAGLERELLFQIATHMVANNHLSH